MSMTTYERCAVMRAYDNGDKIQERFGFGPWRDWDNPDRKYYFSFHPGYEYRIKPSPPIPRDFWIKRKDKGTCSNSLEVRFYNEATATLPSCEEAEEWIHVREVTE